MATELPSSTFASPTTSLGLASSFVIVPVATLVPRSALNGDESVTVKVWLPSTKRSPVTETSICFEVSPAAKTSVPDLVV